MKQPDSNRDKWISGKQICRDNGVRYNAVAFAVGSGLNDEIPTVEWSQPQCDISPYAVANRRSSGGFGSGPISAIRASTRIRTPKMASTPATYGTGMTV